MDDRRTPTVIVAHPSAELYGSDRMMLESVTALIDEGYRVVVTVPADGPLLTLIRERGAEVRICPTAVLRKSALRPRGMLRLIRDLTRGAIAGSRLLGREKPSLVYVNTVTIPLWLGLAKVRRIPTLCHVHEGESSASRLLRAGVTMPLHLADGIVANSSFSAGVVASTSATLGDRVEVIFNGVPGPGEKSKARESLTGPVRLAYVGRLSPRKGVDVAVDAVRLLRDRGRAVSLDIVGGVFTGYEWFETQLRERAESLGVEDVVTFHGFQPDIWQALDAADVVLVPSRADEPFGNAAVEGMLAARPVIASSTSGLLEATAGYRSAFPAVPDDAAAIADAVDSIAEDWDTVRENAWRDARLAEQRHSPAVYREQIADAASLAMRRKDVRSRPAPAGHRRGADVQETY